MSNPTVLSLSTTLPYPPHPEEIFVPLMQQHFNVVSLADLNSDPDGLAPKITALETFTTIPVRRELMDRLPNLGMIASSAVGLDNIDLEYAFNKRIKVSFTPNLVTEATANQGITHLLALTRRLVELDQYIRDGHWLEKDKTPYGVSLQGKNIGIIGLGRIGRSVAEKCRAFGMNILYTSRSEKPGSPGEYYEDLTEMARNSHFLMACCDLNEGTKGIVNRDVLQALGREGFFINIARGGVVDQNALIDALTSRDIKGAGLDVFDDEPHVPRELINLPRSIVILSPHVGSKDYETRVKMAKMTVDNLLAFYAGEKLPNPVLGFSGLR